MNPSFEQTLVEVWRQALVENTEVIETGKERYSVKQFGSAHGLNQVRELRRYVFDNSSYKATHQHPVSFDSTFCRRLGEVWQACEELWSVAYSAGNPRAVGARNGVDDARYRCSFARFRDCWAFARNEVLRFARNIRRVAHGRRSIGGGGAPSCRFRFSAGGLAILPRLGNEHEVCESRTS